jgi:hypothetical protein
LKSSLLSLITNATNAIVTEVIEKLISRSVIKKFMFMHTFGKKFVLRPILPFLVVEEAHVLFDECDTQALSSLEDSL